MLQSVKQDLRLRWIHQHGSG